jgi:hypothetical protein
VVGSASSAMNSAASNTGGPREAWKMYI